MVLLEKLEVLNYANGPFLGITLIGSFTNTLKTKIRRECLDGFLKLYLQGWSLITQQVQGSLGTP